ncbi:uncharacterized protein [Cherax quadricarinatus]|uniref:uncharacterized protein isoform X3 n=1 Tax=Cherax quadricarinatus TaxID=27406 RepID=UPI00387E5701
MQCKLFNTCPWKTIIFVLASAVLILYYHVLASPLLLPKLPPPNILLSSSRNGSPSAQVPRTTNEDLGKAPFAHNSNLRYKNMSKINKPIPDGTEVNAEADANSYKIELIDDTGEDYQPSSEELSFKLILKGVDLIHQAAKTYIDNIKYNLQNKTKFPQTTLQYTQDQENTTEMNQINNQGKNSTYYANKVQEINETHDHILSTVLPHYDMQEKISLNACNILLNLAPCSCVRNVASTIPSCPSQEMGLSQIIARINGTVGESTCSDWATMRGSNQSVISFSLFGKFPSPYYRGAFTLMQRLSRVYPGWSVRFYHDLDISDPEKAAWVCSLSCKYEQLDFCYVGNLPGAGLGDIQWTIGTIWRLAVMGDPLVSRFIIRDTDSPVLLREVEAVHEWLSSDKQLLWPTLKKSHLAHDAFYCHKFPGSRPFPSRRQNYTFVGMRTLRDAYSDDSIHDPCPIECRPTHHKDWEYC